jgi:hypothetical protein
MPVSGAEAVPLIFKNGLPKCNDELPSVLTWLSKVYSKKQAGALSGSNQEQSLRDDYDDRRSRFESRSPCTAPRDRGSNRSNSDDRRDRATSPDRQQNGPLDLTRASNKCIWWMSKAQGPRPERRSSELLRTKLASLVTDLC